jgi:hypothetical protein
VSGRLRVRLTIENLDGSVALGPSVSVDAGDVVGAAAIARRISAKRSLPDFEQRRAQAMRAETGDSAIHHYAEQVAADELRSGYILLARERPAAAGPRWRRRGAPGAAARGSAIQPAARAAEILAARSRRSPAVSAGSRRSRKRRHRSGVWKSWETRQPVMGSIRRQSQHTPARRSGASSE